MDIPSLPVDLSAPWHFPELEEVEAEGHLQLEVILSKGHFPAFLPPRHYKHLADVQHCRAEG